MAATAKFSLYVRKNREKGQGKYGIEAHERICAFVEGANIANEGPLPEDLAILSAVDGIDSGEAILLALCSRTAGSIFVTGDKRALRALGSVAGLEEIRAALQGRVYCLECVIRLSIEHLGFAVALPRIVSGCKCDKVLEIAFASGLKTTATNADEALRSYEEGLRKETAGLLCGR